MTKRHELTAERIAIRAPCARALYAVQLSQRRRVWDAGVDLRWPAIRPVMQSMALKRLLFAGREYRNSRLKK